MWDIRAEVETAERRIRGYVRETPLDPSPYLSDLIGCQVFLKLENLQHTGSFKYRGAMNKLLTLGEKERKAGVIAASTGNHGLAVAHALDRLGVSGTVYLPENASPQKIEMLRRYDVSLSFHGTESAETEVYARKVGEKTGKAFISPYNDPRVVGGQGTVGVELLHQTSSIDCILVSVGGGGLITGIAGYLKEGRSQIEIIGCLPRNSPVMYNSIRAGRIVPSRVLPTWSDGTAGGVEAGSITFDPCQKYVDDWVLVSEEEIQEGMKLIFDQHRMVIEGSAAVSVASLLKVRGRLHGKNVTVVICGGNVDITKFKELVCEK